MIKSVAKVAGAVILILVLNFIFQLPSFFEFIRSFFFAHGTLTSIQYWFFDLFVNMTVSAVITVLALLLVRGMPLSIVVISIVVQLVWYLIFHNYVGSPETIGDVLLRTSGFLGLVLGASLPLIIVKSMREQSGTDHE